MTIDSTVPPLHLRVHSHFSLLEGMMSGKDIAACARRSGMPAVGISDTGNCFGAIELASTLVSAGIQPVIGSQIALSLTDSVSIPASRGAMSQSQACIAVYAADQRGWHNLMALSSRSYLDPADENVPSVTLEQLIEFSEGLILLTGGPHGPVDLALRNRQNVLAQRLAERLASGFQNRMYVEIQRHDDLPGAEAEARLVELADRMGLPLVASVEPYFSSPEDARSNQVLRCIRSGELLEQSNGISRRGHWFQSSSELNRRFHDLPDALRHTVEIARRVSFFPADRAPLMPRYHVAPADRSISTGDADADILDREEQKELESQARSGLDSRLKTHGLAFEKMRSEYDQRLEYELSVIVRMRYSGYFLVVSDFIRWAKREGIPVGPGRGSGAGSLVAWSLDIIDIDPIGFGLLFERFLNPDRVSLPDFDVDFCQERRDEVVDYVRGRYGERRVANIVTFGTLQARAALRDVGRVLNIPLWQINRLCKLVPSDVHSKDTLSTIIKNDERLSQAAEEDVQVAGLFDYASRLEGLYRHVSTHAAGIVIADRDLDTLVPLLSDTRTHMPVTQYSWKVVERAGLVKFDFLGLKTLTMIERASEFIQRRIPDFNILMVPLTDEATYAMLGRAETTGVFQLESQGMRNVLSDMQPDRIQDITALVSLYRPGPMANIPAFCRRKRGDEPIEYLHPLLEPILEETFGVIVYQEQVMEIARAMFGFTLGEADSLRRAMGKKIRSEIMGMREKSLSGARKLGIASTVARRVFDLIEKFAEYGFPKGHGAAYAVMAYRTAYLKANFPVEYLAASMSLDKGNTSKLAELWQEAIRLSLEKIPVCVNRSAEDFDVVSGAITYGLSAVKGVGSGSARVITEARNDKAFSGMHDFVTRVNVAKVGRKAMEALVAAGAFDELDDRRRLFENISVFVRMSERIRETSDRGQHDLFGGSGLQTEELDQAISEPGKWKTAELLQREFNSIGFFITGHPLDSYQEPLSKFGVRPWSEFQQRVREEGKGNGLIAAVLQSISERNTRSGSRMGIVNLSDASGGFEAVLFSDVLSANSELLTEGNKLLLQISSEAHGDELRTRISDVKSLDEALNRMSRCIHVELARPDGAELKCADVEAIKSVISDQPGRSNVIFLMNGPIDGSRVRISLESRRAISADTIYDLEALSCVTRVSSVDPNDRSPEV